MDGLEYLNLDILIEDIGRNKYRANIYASPAGQAEQEFRNPFKPLELENFFLRIAGHRQIARRIDSPELNLVRDFGRKLFECIFGPETYSCYQNSLILARKDGKGLRIRLHIEAPALSNLPWEYLYNAKEDRFLSHSMHTPIVRYIDLPYPPEPLCIEPRCEFLS
jgi:hypothetical protein